MYIGIIIVYRLTTIWNEVQSKLHNITYRLIAQTLWHNGVISPLYSGKLTVEISGPRELYIEEGSLLVLSCIVKAAHNPPSLVYW